MTARMAATMSETSAADASTPQPLGMPATDFTSHQLREARARAVSLAAKNERLVTALGAARERIAELGQQLDAVTHPPVTLGCRCRRYRSAPRGSREPVGPPDAPARPPRRR